MSSLPKAGHINLERLTRYKHIPALLLGQMARNLNYARQSMGPLMFDWVINYGTQLSKRVGCRLIMLNSDLDKIKWYKDNSFVLLKEGDNIMYIDMLEPNKENQED